MSCTVGSPVCIKGGDLGTPGWGGPAALQNILPFFTEGGLGTPARDPALHTGDWPLLGNPYHLQQGSVAMTIHDLTHLPYHQSRNLYKASLFYRYLTSTYTI